MSDDTLICKTVESNSAQTAFEFAEVMARTQLSDGANMLPDLPQLANYN